MNVYRAFVVAGVPEEQAQKAAEELAGYESRFGSMDGRLAKIEGELATLRWMVGTNIALTFAGFGILFRYVVH